MSLKDKIQDEMKTAMRAKDKAALRTLRAIKAAILITETAEGRDGAALTAEEDMKLLVKQAKQRRDSITQFQENGREDLAATEIEELEVIERFLPKQMDEAELKAGIEAIVAETGASSMKDMGKVMGLASKRYAGKADGKAISMIVKQLLG